MRSVVSEAMYCVTICNKTGNRILKNRELLRKQMEVMHQKRQLTSKFAFVRFVYWSVRVGCTILIKGRWKAWNERGRTFVNTNWFAICRAKWYLVRSNYDNLRLSMAKWMSCWLVGKRQTYDDISLFFPFSKTCCSFWDKQWASTAWFWRQS